MDQIRHSSVNENSFRNLIRMFSVTAVLILMAIEAAVIRKQRREFTLLKINGVPSRALSPIPFLQRFPDYTAMLLLSMILRLRTVLQYTFILPVTEAVLLILLSWYLSAMRIEDILRS